MRPVRIAQIGVGHDHASPTYDSLRRQTGLFELVGIAEPDAARAVYEGSKRYTVEGLLAMPDLEAVAIETEERLSTQYAQAFAELDEMRRHANEQEEAQRVNEARSELRRKLNEHEGKLKTAKPEPPREEKKSARNAEVGDTVEILSMGVKAEVVGVNSDGSLELKAGIMNVKAKQSEVCLVEGKAAKKKVSYNIQSSTVRSAVSSEIDLRGMESIEAVNAAEMYIDNAVMAKLSTVTIIHGKGTGALRAAIHQMLKRNKAVKSFRLGRYGEGETGVTIVELK